MCFTAPFAPEIFIPEFVAVHVVAMQDPDIAEISRDAFAANRQSIR
jgi:hypothetical protein